MFVQPPPARVHRPEPHPHADCTTSVALPIIDGVVTGYEAFRTLYALSGQGSYQGSPIDRRTDAALGAAFAGVFLASTIYGAVSVSRCRRLRAGPAPDEPIVGVTRDPPPDEPAPGESISPGPSSARASRRAPALLSAHDGSEMWRRPEPQGAAWKR